MVGRKQARQWYIVDSAGCIVAWVPGPKYNPEIEATVKVLAAAADMLAALEHVKECLRPFIENPKKGKVKGTPMDLSVICQAIAKAKGNGCTTPK